MLWLLFSFSAPIVWAITNVIDKYVLSKLVKDSWIPGIAFGFAGFIASLVIIVLKGFPLSTNSGLIVALVTGVVYIAAEQLYFKATQEEEISRVISLIYLDPLFTAVLSAFFLGEIFSPLKYIGVVLLVIGAIVISFKFAEKFTIKKAVWLAIFSALLFGAVNILNKYLLSQNDFWAVFSYVRVGTFAALLPIIYQKRQMLLEMAVKQTRVFSLIVFNGFLTLSGTFLFLIAMSLGYATLTSAISASQPFFVLIMTLLLGVFFPYILKEEGGKIVFFQKLFAIILMIVGVILVNS